ncbi:unnamed protein product [Microthlaspi erraticum]|uniref:Uncharacterized protein n=1 Tax=Microthlaspi erraticum TaxID=1685480 RepID=A0A6D2J1B8_9BRAS|nr:unnamed protein product [Microthlaspi erraticum]
MINYEDEEKIKLLQERYGRDKEFPDIYEEEDRIKEVMLILNEPIRFSYPAAWKMDQWKGAIQAEWIMMDGAAVGVPQHHWSTKGKRWRHSGGGDHSHASLPSL